jgi:hypothetical protein
MDGKVDDTSGNNVPSTDDVALQGRKPGALEVPPLLHVDLVVVRRVEMTLIARYERKFEELHIGLLVVVANHDDEVLIVTPDGKEAQMRDNVK